MGRTKHNGHSLTTSERKALDLIKPKEQVLAWIRRLQMEYYCELCENDEGMMKNLYGTSWKDHTGPVRCTCTGWDYHQSMYRFYLCSHARPMELQTWKELVPMVDKHE